VAVTIYGIPNCDTMKKARAWLDAQGIVHAFHDYKRCGIDAAVLAGWCDVLGWERVLNRAGTTFRKLPDAVRADLDRDRAMSLMRDQPSMIKRPVLDVDGRLLLGFDAAAWAKAF
jgi:arsenate reductase